VPRFGGDQSVVGVSSDVFQLRRIADLEPVFEIFPELGDGFVFVVTITMLISVPAAFALSRMRFWGSATLATGVFLTYLIPTPCCSCRCSRCSRYSMHGPASS